ncbi:MAG: HAD family hydrolase [Verrucomicrobiales bacterium]
MRVDARQELERLRARGLRIEILSGDRTEKVEALGRALGIAAQDCRGGMSPGDKAARVRTRESSLFIGDGANDSLAFEEALCRGTPVADGGVIQRKADFCFLGQGLRAVGDLLVMAERRRRVVFRVFVFASGYNAIAVALCLGGWMSPLLAAILMPLSSIASLALVVAGLGWGRVRLELQRKYV